MQAPLTVAHVKHFTLTAEPALIQLGAGVVIRGWGFNGVTIHWHGVRVPNSSDTIRLNNQPGTSLGRMGMTYTLNGKVFPYTGMMMVHLGQLIEIRFVNQSKLYHPMLLHGHMFTVLVAPHETYDVAFVADNPGIWMLHCHNFLHANWGIDMMVEYYGYTTPYTMGSKTNNFPD